MENAKKWKDTPWPWITINIMKTAQKKNHIHTKKMKTAQLQTKSPLHSKQKQKKLS